MNWDEIEGKWKQMSGSLRKQWGKLTDDDVEQVRGDRDRLVGKIQEQYGVAKAEAERQVDQWTRSV